jgi:uncharacterized membrane protein
MAEMMAAQAEVAIPATEGFSQGAMPTIRKTVEILGWGVVAILMITGFMSIFGRAEFLQSAYEQGVTDGIAAFDLFDGRYFDHDVATWLHLIPAFLIFGLGPLQFIRRIRTRHLSFHRWSGRIWLVAGFIVALSGSFIGVLYPFMDITGQGFNESMATLFLALYTLLSLSMAYYHIRRRNFGSHREWMIRSWALMLAVATERLLLVFFMSTTPVGVEVLFGTTFWMAGLLNIAASECWINLTRTPGNGARHWKDLDARARQANS